MEALRALHISDRDDPINEVIAQRIIEGARAGVRDPKALCKMAVQDLMVPWGLTSPPRLRIRAS